MKYDHLFIVGAGRSGTTFLWRIMNNSPEVHLCTEIHYFSSLYHSGFLKNFRKYKKKKSISSDDIFNCLTDPNNFGMYWIKNPYFAKDEVKKYFSNRKLTEKSIYKYLFDHDLFLTGKNSEKIKYIGEKTPLNIFHLRKLLDWFPEAHFLFIFRNPINVLKSEANKPEKPDFPLNKSNFLYTFFIIIFVYFEWLLASLIALYYKNKLKDNFHIIKYEDLKDSKHLTLYNICKKLKINYDSKLYHVPKIGSSFDYKKHSNYWLPSFYTKTLFRSLYPISLQLKKYL